MSHRSPVVNNSSSSSISEPGAPVKKPFVSEDSPLRNMLSIDGFILLIIGIIIILIILWLLFFYQNDDKIDYKEDHYMKNMVTPVSNVSHDTG